MEAFADLKGRLRLDKKHRILSGGIPMILTPRWFFVNVQKELEKSGGRKMAKAVYYRAGFTSAYNYCRTQRKAQKMAGTETIPDYLGSMSVRGWGKFKIVHLDIAKGKGIFRLEQSAFGEEYGPRGRAVCHCWPGAMAGAVQEILDAQGRLLHVQGKELKCKSKGDKYCEFVVSPIRKI
jgi:predicted hydrocarbon binding protein